MPESSKGQVKARGKSKSDSIWIEHTGGAIEVSEERFRVFVQNARTPVAMLDREMKYLAASPRWCSDYRLGDVDVVGSNHYDVFPETPHQWKEIHRRCLRGDSDRCEEAKFPRADGTIDWVRWQILPWRNAQREIGGLLMFTEVLTARKRAEQALREKDEQLQTNLGAAGVGTWERDLRTGEIRWSEAMQRLHGLAPGSSQPSFETFLEFVHPEDRDRIHQSFQQAMDTGDEIDVEYRCAAGGGNMKWLARKGRVLFGETRAPIRTMGICIDITERKRAQEALQESYARMEERVRERTAELEKANRELRLQIAQRRRTEWALGESEERLRLLVEGIRDYEMIMLDPAGFILSCNLAAERIKGYRSEEIIGKHFSVFYRAEDVQAGKPERDLEIAMSEGRFEEESWCMRKNGSLFWANVVITPLHDSSGTLRGFSKVTRDISDRKRVEEDLREANAILTERARLLDLAHDAIIVRDPNSSIVSWNSGAERTYGWTRDEALGKVTHSLLETEFPQPAEDAERQLFSQNFWEGELVHRRRDGKRITVASRQVLERDGQGRPSAILEINRDITERKRAQEEVARRNNRLVSLMDKSPLGIVLLDAQGRIELCNPAFEKLFLYGLAEIRGLPLADVICSLESPDKWTQALASIAPGETVHSSSLRRRKDGAWVNIEIYGVPLVENGELIGAYGLYQDVTERVRYQQAQRDNEEALRRLSAQIVQLRDHERRTVARELHDSTSPAFASLISKLYQAKRRIHDLDATSSILVSDAVALAESLAREIRTVSYLLHPPLLDERGFLAALRWYLEGYSNRTGIRVETDFPEKPARLSKDAELALFRIVQECLTNTLRYSGSTVARVRLLASQQELMLEVSDEGCGFPSDVVQRWKAGDVTELGVGISGMRERLRHLGGRLEIDSSAAGAVVRAIMPVKADEHVTKQRVQTAGC